MITVGVDLAAQTDRTAIAVVEWSAAGATVVELATGGTDEQIVQAVLASQRAGIDCPFGWPEGFVDLVTAHRDHRVIPPTSSGRDWRRGLALRETDLHVYHRTGLTPLSVSADRIGHVAMRCAALLASLELLGVDCDREGTGRVAEVYPAAALKLWRLPHRSYKRASNQMARNELIDMLLAGQPWLDLGDTEHRCRTSDDCLDAVISALMARAVAGNQTESPPAGNAAAREGWIHLPTVPIGDLPGTPLPLPTLPA